MKILAIETSSAQGTVALLDEGRLVAEADLGSGSRHGRELVPCVDRVLGGDPDGVGLLAVSAGPGSYTGLRVGITFAKTFAGQTGVPVVGVSSLDVIAANAPDAGRRCVVVDARLGRVYAALYDPDGKKIVEDFAAPPEAVAAKLGPEEATVLGDGLRRYRDVFAAVEGAALIEDESQWRPRAAHVGRLGEKAFNERGGEDPGGLVPRYLSRPPAEVKWEASHDASGPK